LLRHSSSDGGLREFAIWIVPYYSDQRMSTVTGAAPTAGRLLIRKRLPFGATAYWKRATRAAPRWTVQMEKKKAAAAAGK
jgi:hypothetical protein